MPESLTILTPIMPGQEGALATYLESLKPEDSPLQKVAATHFARLVIVPSFVTDPKQRKADPLGCQYLLFTSNLDGTVDDYLTSLVNELDSEAAEIWGKCIGAPTPAAGDALKAYLLHNKIEDGLFFSAYPATVPEVTKALDVRNRLVQLAIATQGSDPAAIQKAFLKEFGA